MQPKGTKVESSLRKWYKDKIALITGATSGIGSEFARILASYGSRLILCGRDSKSMAALAEELKVKGSVYDAFLADFSEVTLLEDTILKVKNNYRVDIVVNNAGFGNMCDFYCMPKEKINTMIGLNIYVMVRICREFIPEMIKRRGTGIINVGSVASFFGTPGSGLYGATKHFVLGFTDALHEELRHLGVNVTGLYPGHTNTKFLERASEGKMKKWHKAMSASAVAMYGLDGLYKNKIRVIPGFENKLKVWTSPFFPITIISKKIYRDYRMNLRIYE